MVSRRAPCYPTTPSPYSTPTETPVWLKMALQGRQYLLWHSPITTITTRRPPLALQLRMSSASSAAAAAATALRTDLIYFQMKKMETKRWEGAAPLAYSSPPAKKVFVCLCKTVTLLYPVRIDLNFRMFNNRVFSLF